jgi:hypothetical protein
LIKNFGNTRNSEDDQSTVNGNDYIDVARAYYNSTMYDDGLQATEGIFDTVLPVFNAIPKVVNIASALSVGGDIESVHQDKEWVDNVVKNIMLEQEKSFIARELILGKSVLIEIQTEQENPVDVDFPYNLSYYSADEYDVISVGQDIYYAKIKGVQFVLNDEGDGYEEVDIEKIYIKNNETGEAKSYILDEDGNKQEEITYPDGKLPLVEITTTYDMKQLFFSIDRYNEYESFIRSILYLAGEPIIAGIGLDRIQKQAKEDMAKDRMKKQKTLFTRTETAKLQLLEINGSSAKVMIEKQHGIVENIIKDYPEYSISEVLSGSNVSEETTRIRLTEILSRVTELRRNLERGFNKVIGIIAFLDGKDEEERYITLGDMVDVNMKDILDNAVTAYTNGLISRKSAMSQIKEMFINEDVEAEFNEVIKEEEEKAKKAQEMAQAQGGEENGNDNRQGKDDSSATG